MSCAGIPLQSIKGERDLQRKTLISSQWLLEGVYKTYLLSLKYLRETFASLCSGHSLRTRFDSKPPWYRTFPFLPLLKRPSTAVINFWRCSIMLSKCDCNLECCKRGRNKQIKICLMRCEVEWTDVLHWILLQSSHPVNTCEVFITGQFSFLVSEVDRQDDPNLLCAHFRFEFLKVWVKA